MNAKPIMPWLALIAVTMTMCAPAENPPAAPSGPAEAPGLRKLTGVGERRVKQLEEAIVRAENWSEAIAAAEAILALRTRVQGPIHFETVSASWRAKTYRRVAALSKDDQAAWFSANNMFEQASTLYAQDKYTEALPFFEKALGIRRRLLTDNHPETASIYESLAAILYAQGKHAQARPLCEKALEIKHRLLTDDHPDTAACYIHLATILTYQGKYAQAQPLFEKALEIRRRLLTDDHADTAESYNVLAINLSKQGKYAQAQPLYEKALEIRRRVLTDDHLDTAASYNNLANNLQERGKYAQAQPLHEKALEIYRRLLTDDQPETAASYNNLAINLNAQGKYSQAQPLYEKALEIKRRLLTDDHPDSAASYNNLAINLMDQGKYAQAQPLDEKALEIKRRLLTDDHRDTAVSYANLAINLDKQGKYAQAEPLFEKAVEIDRRLLTDDHPETAASYLNLANNLSAQGRFTEARDQWIRAALGLEAARLDMAFAGLERTIASQRRGDPLLALAAVLARLGEHADAWQRLEQDLGRGLLDELAARQDKKLSTLERDHVRKLVANLEQLDGLFEAPVGKVDQAGREQQLEDLRRRRERARIALDELRSQLARKYGALAGQVATLQEIQAALPADAALLTWVDLSPPGPNAADPSGEHWGVVVRSQGTPAWVRLPGTGKNRGWTADDSKLTELVQTSLPQRPGLDAADPQPLIDRLRAQRLAPVTSALAAAAGLPAARRLIVLPSRALTGVPVEALLQPGDPWTVSYAPSATVWNYLRKQSRETTPGGLLALGDPVFQDFQPLPGTRFEAEALAGLFKNAKRTTLILTGAQASEPNLDRMAAAGELGKFAFIHLATHGVIDDSIPVRSAVILTQTGLPDPLSQVLSHQPVYDGQLTVREIQRGWDLKADLVTLSACETARGQYLGGEGFVGFTQALLMSGARSVCLSLWKVDDTATALLMQRFYSNMLGARPGLSQPMPKVAALAEAKEWLRSLTTEKVEVEVAAMERGEKRKLVTTAGARPAGPRTGRPFSHPYFWAAFVLVGDVD